METYLSVVKVLLVLCGSYGCMLLVKVVFVVSTVLSLDVSQGKHCHIAVPVKLNTKF